MPEEECAPEQYCSIGLHPWNIGPNFHDEMEKIRDFAAKKNVLLIGEVGLDKLRGAELKLQETVFIEHIRISEEIGKPLIIHCVKAFDEIISMRKRMHPHQQWVIHGFRGKPQQAHQLLDNGFHLSFGEHFNTESLRLCPADHLLIETDESLIDIETLYTRAATLRDIGVEMLKEQVSRNIRCSFWGTT
jgi:TatD DNase family protein